MNQLPRHDQQILLSLATEIRQAKDWLDDASENTPSRAEWKARLSTLKEAAEAAGMQSIRSALDNLQQKNVDRDLTGIDRDDSRIQKVLHQLADMLSALATSAESHPFVWIDCIQDAQAILDRTAQLSSQSTLRLADCLRALQQAATSVTREEQIEYLTKLGNTLKKVINHHDQQHENIQTIKNQLQDASRNLMQKRSGLSTVPFFPGLATLREQIHRSGRELGKPVTLELGNADIELPTSQIEPISRVLDFLTHQALREGIEKPERRLKLGKSELARIKITASSNGSVVNIHIEDDGNNTRGAFRLTRSIKQDLWKLRARLLMQQLPQQGTSVSLQLPDWLNTVEVIPLECDVGPLFLPLSVVSEAFSKPEYSGSRIPKIHLRPNQAATQEETGCVVVIQVGHWKALLDAHTLQSPRRVNPVPANIDDPAWVLGRVEGARESRPIFHPLPFVAIKKGQSCLYP